MQSPTDKFDWRPLAESLGLRLGPETQSILPGRSSAEIAGTLNDVDVHVDVHQIRVMSEGEYGLLNARKRELLGYRGGAHVSVAYRLGHGPRFSLLRQGTLRTWLKQFGYQDIEIGHHALDFQLTIKGDAPEQVKSVLLADVEPLRVYVEGRAGDLPVSDGTTITANVELATPEREKDLRRLHDLIVLLSTMAAADLGGLGALRRLPGATESTQRSETAVVSVRCPSTVEFVPEWKDGTFATTARAKASRFIEPGTVSCSDASAVATLCGLSSLEGHLGKLADATLTVASEQIQIAWPKVIEDHEILMAAANLLSRIAAPGGEGAYR